MEATLLLVAFAQQWRLRLATDRPIELQPLVTLRPRHGLSMIVERRRPAIA